MPVRRTVEMVGLLGEDNIGFLRKSFEPYDRPEEFDELGSHNVETGRWRRLHSFSDIPQGGLPAKAFLFQTRSSVSLSFYLY